jgi:hypothetical protein
LMNSNHGYLWHKFHRLIAIYHSFDKLRTKPVAK